jgi:mono/diheme cytochrome c family protein
MLLKLIPSFLPRVSITVLLTVGFGFAAAAQQNVDHAGIIGAWDAQSVVRGGKLFVLACAPCHGTDGAHPINPQARRFSMDKFQTGSDPYSLYKTITHGYKNMPSQAWMTPAQRYDVIHYVRETFLKTSNPSQYTAIDAAYLESLPKFNRLLPAGDQASKERDFGPVLESQLDRSLTDALSFKLDEKTGLSYDLHRMKMAAAWQGGFLDLSQTGHALQRGEGRPRPDGKLLTGLQHWCWAFDGTFDYPTNDLLPRGPLPERWLRYHGHYVNGKQAVLSYSIQGREILETPGAVESSNQLVITHSLRIGPGAAPLRLCVAQPDEDDGGVMGMVQPGQMTPGGQSGLAGENIVMASFGKRAEGLKVSESRKEIDLPPAYKEFVSSSVVGEVAGLRWSTDKERRLILEIPPGTRATTLQVLCFAGNGEADIRWFGQFADERRRATLEDPESLTHGAPRLWPETIEEKGTPGVSKGAYVLDTVPVPFKNPYNAWPRTSALAFFPDGRAVVTTYGGDVWIVSGLDAGLEHVVWSRFASGLFEPMGAQVIDGLIYVTCRNGIVRLHDLNGDGEADFYETFYADRDVSGFFHSFAFDLQRDHQGNLYYAKSGQYTDFKFPGAVIKVSRDGSAGQIYCTGFRTPNGMGILPDDRVTVSDNQGNWMPASKINIVRPGGFYGYVQNLESGSDWAPDGGRIDVKHVSVPQKFDQPIIWMPQEFDNSSGGEVFADDPRFGPLAGRLLHTSFGKGWMYYLMLQRVGDVDQSAIVALPFQFEAGIMRARVNPGDGQVYAVGLSGWQGPDGGKDGCLQRLRYTGKSVKLLDDVKVAAGGISLKFNFDLDPASATNAASYHLEEWNYHWTRNYGSDQYSLAHPERKGHDEMAIHRIDLSDDRRSVFLAIEGIRPVNQIELRLNLAGADNEVFKELAYLTVNAVPR